MCAPGREKAMVGFLCPKGVGLAASLFVGGIFHVLVSDIFKADS